MNFLTNVPSYLDPYLIQLYRISGYALVDFFVGTFLLALITVVIGEFTLSLALRINRRHIESMENELTEQHNLSMAALVVEDKKSYKACNDQANDAFGRYFFNMIAYSAACLWPVPFALSWLQSRFLHVDFKLAYPLSLIWPSTTYITVFVLLYILARIVFKNIRRYLPYFRQVQKTLDLQSGGQNRQLVAEPGLRAE